MSTFPLVSIRCHCSKKLLVEIRRARKCCFYSSGVPTYVLGLFNRCEGASKSLTNQQMRTRDSSEDATTRRAIPFQAVSRSKQSPGSLRTCKNVASLSTVSCHRNEENDADLNENLNGGSPEPSPLDFTRISHLIESDRGVVDTSSIWYVVTAAALLGLNQHSTIERLWKYISDQCGQDKSKMLSIARRIREACLKSSVLVGFPHGINGLLSLHSSIEKHSPSITTILASDTSLRAGLTPAEKYSRGKDFFSSIYSKHTDRVLASMGNSSGGDLDYYAVASVYGELMAETSILGAVETGILEFVCCLVGDVAPQAKGHFFGCRNLGTTGKQMRGTISLVTELATQLKILPDRMPGVGPRYKFLEKAAEW